MPPSGTMFGVGARATRFSSAATSPSTESAALSAASGLPSSFWSACSASHFPRSAGLFFNRASRFTVTGAPPRFFALKAMLRPSAFSNR